MEKIFIYKMKRLWKLKTFKLKIKVVNMRLKII